VADPNPHWLRARDPNTPVIELLRLLLSFADDVLQNPAFSLAMLEQPDLWGRVNVELVRPVASSRWCPASFVVWAVASPHVELLAPSLIENSALAPNLRRLALEHFFVPEKTWRLLHRALSQFLSPPELNLLARAQVAPGFSPPQDPSLTEEEFALLVALGLSGQALAVAQGTCPTAVVQRFVRSRDYRLRVALARNPGLDLKTQLALAADLHPWVREALAENPGRLPEVKAKQEAGKRPR
jgi:hypothetical protein